MISLIYVTFLRKAVVRRSLSVSLRRQEERRKVKFDRNSFSVKAHLFSSFLYLFYHRSPRSFQLSLFSPFYVFLPFRFARRLLYCASPSLLRRSFSATAFTSVIKSEREKGVILSLFYSSVSEPANGWREQGRHRQNREEYECGEANAADCRVPFFPPFLPSLQLLLLPSFVRPFARTLIRSSIFFLLPFFEPPRLRFIRRFLAFHPKKAGTRAAARWEPGPGLSRIWNNVYTTILARGTPGRIVWNNFLDDLTTGRCRPLETIRHSDYYFRVIIASDCFYSIRGFIFRK